MARLFSFAPILALVLLTGCATGMAGSSRRLCYDSGLQPGTQAFTDCWHAERSRQFQGDEAGIAIGLGIAAAQNQPRPAARSNPLLKDPPRQCVYFTPQGQRTMLPVNGVCPLYYGQ